jgi:hypothetical protein
MLDIHPQLGGRKRRKGFCSLGLPASMADADADVVKKQDLAFQLPGRFDCRSDVLMEDTCIVSKFLWQFSCCLQ